MRHVDTEAIDQDFVESFNAAINNPENENDLGNGVTTLDWDFVSADMHLDLRYDGYSHRDITDAFNLLADIYMEAA